jgi:hypothetical protein
MKTSKFDNSSESCHIQVESSESEEKSVNDQAKEQFFINLQTKSFQKSITESQYEKMTGLTPTQNQVCAPNEYPTSSIPAYQLMQNGHLVDQSRLYPYGQQYPYNHSQTVLHQYSQHPQYFTQHVKRYYIHPGL